QLVVAVVERGALVLDLDRSRDDAEAVREALRNPELTAIRGRELAAEPEAEGRRAAANVDRDVEDRALDGAHQLALRAPDLGVQAAQDGPFGARVVVLHEDRVNARG